MNNDKKQKKLERNGWKFQFIHSTATGGLRFAPVIASNGFKKLRGTSLTDVFKQIRSLA